MTSWEQNSAKIDVQNRSNLLKIARFSWLASARKRTCVLTVCQQQRWQVLEHCANSRIRAGVGPKSVLTVDVSVLTLERRPWLLCNDGWSRSSRVGPSCPERAKMSLQGPGPNPAAQNLKKRLEGGSESRDVPSAPSCPVPKRPGPSRCPEGRHVVSSGAR